MLNQIKKYVEKAHTFNITKKTLRKIDFFHFSHPNLGVKPNLTLEFFFFRFRHLLLGVATVMKKIVPFCLL